MEFLVKMRERLKNLTKGQTMTEYALILAAVAIIVYGFYLTMGNDIGSLVSRIDNDLTAS